MKKTLFFWMATASMAIMMSCGGGSGQQQMAVAEDDTSAVNAIPRDKTLYGLCGDGTAMNTLQLLLGDRIAVLPNATNSEAVIVINQNALLGDWVMPNPIDGSSEVGIRIKEGGVAESIEQSSIIYKTWKIFNGRLEILSQRDGGGDEEELNLYELVKLGPDTLVYRTMNKPREEMETFEYSRWKEPEKMDLHGLQLEDAADEFHL